MWICTAVMDGCGLIIIKKSFTRQIGTSFAHYSCYKLDSSCCSINK